MTQVAPSNATPLRSKHGSVAYWACQAFGWGTYVLVTILETRGSNGFRGGRVAEVVFAACLGAALTHAFRRFMLDRGWPAKDLRALAPRIFVAPIALAAIFVFPLWILERFVLGDHPSSPWLNALAAVVRWALVFFVWEALYFGVDLVRARRRAETLGRELETALTAARLRSLESQLNPHFLFNALNTVRALIPDDPARAQTAVTQVASILRHSLGAGRENLAPFGSELGVVEDYLAIEALRLGDRLRVERSVDPGALAAQIPPMLFQTLVENAVKHGIAELRGGGTLAFSARMTEGAMLLTVDNPRPTDGELVRSMEASNGVGLINAKERLRLLFGDAASLEMDLSNPRHATARVRIPLAP